MIFEPLPDNVVYEIRASTEVWRYKRLAWGNLYPAFSSHRQWDFVNSFKLEDSIKNYGKDKLSIKIKKGSFWNRITQPGWIIVQSWNNEGWFETKELEYEYKELYEEYRIFKLLSR